MPKTAIPATAIKGNMLVKSLSGVVAVWLLPFDLFCVEPKRVSKPLRSKLGLSVLGELVGVTLLVGFAVVLLLLPLIVVTLVFVVVVVCLLQSENRHKLLRLLLATLLMSVVIVDTVLVALLITFPGKPINPLR